MQRLRLKTTGPNASEAAKQCLAWVEKQLEGAVHPLHVLGMLEMPAKFQYYTVRHGQQHMQGETYDNTDNKLLTHTKLKQEADIWAKHIKTASSKKQGEEAFPSRS